MMTSYTVVLKLEITVFFERLGKLTCLLKSIFRIKLTRQVTHFYPLEVVDDMHGPSSLGAAANPLETFRFLVGEVHLFLNDII